MSNDKSLEAFVRLVQSNDAVREELVAAQSAPDPTRALLDIGARHGYSFTAEEVEEAAEEQVEDVVANEELSDAQLQQVAGGSKYEAFQNIASTFLLLAGSGGHGGDDD